MTRAAQILSGLLAVILAAIAMTYLFNPSAAADANGLNPVTEFGVTNMRTLAASMLMVSVTAAIGAVRKSWVFLVPAALYFLFTALIRVFGIFADGADPSTIRGLILATFLFAVAEFGVQIFKRSERQSAEG